MKTIRFQGEDYDLPAYVASIKDGGEIRNTFPDRGHGFSADQVKTNVINNNHFGFVVFEDEHVEVRWPEDPSKWSYYVDLDAALVAAALRGYEYG